MIRLDHYLVQKDATFSRSFYQHIIKKGGVKINGKVSKKPHFFLEGGEKVDLDAKLVQKMNEPKVIKSNEKEKKAKMKTIITDKNFVVFDKPPHLRTEVATLGFFPVHRLDKDTSGVLVAAKNVVTQGKLQKQWQKRDVKKVYVTLIKGELIPKKGAIEAAIFRSMYDRKKMAVSALHRARKAYTEYEVIDYLGRYSLVHAYPKTGRTHQIRVHFASIGHPVVGDSVYGDLKVNKVFERLYGLKRQFLHAEKLTFKHPETGKQIVATSPLPKDLEDALKLVFINFRG